MTNKTEMVSVPRELADKIQRLLEMASGPHISEMRSELSAAILAPPEDVRAVVDEPVGYVPPDGFKTLNDLGWMTVFRSESMHGTDKPLYHHPQRPMVLPERRKVDSGFLPMADGWNACLDRIAELNK